MEKQPQQQTPVESPKCPRCDSSNTKFCYYNNYSLSQPRHFCKKCKRYWTRGGILRSVPVGGGCRKNKKIKRSISAVDQPLSSSISPTATSSNPNATRAQNNPVFLGLLTNPNPSFEMNGFGFDFQPQVNGFGLGLSNNNGNYHNGSSNPLLSSYSLFESSTNSPTIASLLGSSLHQQKFINNINGGFQGLGSFEEVHMGGNMSLKVKREAGKNCHIPTFQSDLEHMNTSDPTLYLECYKFWNLA